MAKESLCRCNFSLPYFSMAKVPKLLSLFLLDPFHYFFISIYQRFLVCKTTFKVFYKISSLNVCATSAQCILVNGGSTSSSSLLRVYQCIFNTDRKSRTYPKKFARTDVRAFQCLKFRSFPYYNTAQTSS